MSGGRTQRNTRSPGIETSSPNGYVTRSTVCPSSVSARMRWYSLNGVPRGSKNGSGAIIRMWDKHEILGRVAEVRQRSGLTVALTCSGPEGGDVGLARLRGGEPGVVDFLLVARDLPLRRLALVLPEGLHGRGVRQAVEPR